MRSTGRSAAFVRCLAEDAYTRLKKECSQKRGSWGPFAHLFRARYFAGISSDSKNFVASFDVAHQGVPMTHIWYKYPAAIARRMRVTDLSAKTPSISRPGCRSLSLIGVSLVI